MCKRCILILLTLIVTAGLTASCIFDPKQKNDPGDTKTPIVYEDLTKKDHVLNNLQVAYNARDFAEYDKLLDDSFTFIFSEADYSAGKVEFDQWNRVDEVTATSRMLDENLDDQDKRVNSLDLALSYPEGNWTEEPPNEIHPGESWFKKTVDYTLVVKTVASWEYRAVGLKAEFTIRWGESDEGEHWRIVLWRDDVQ